MSNAIEHFSRTRVANTALQVIADTQRNLARLIHEEESVIGRYVRLGRWPHKSVNMFVFENLQPLVSQIKSATILPAAVVNDIDHRPMVNVYDAADMTECTIFVNRRVLEKDGVWDDAMALRALLAHEHGHPLAENDTVRAARELSVEVVVESGSSTASISGILHLLADRLCVHSPQEVFANEIAIRAGFGDALFHLDEGAVAKACVGVRERAALMRSLERQVSDGKLTTGQIAALLLIGDLQAYLGFALETAAFLRAEHPQQAEALEIALIEGVFAHLDPAARPLYENFRDHYLLLRLDMTSADVEAWSRQALTFLADTFRQRGLQISFPLARARASGKLYRRQRTERTPAAHGSVEQDCGSP